MREIFIQPLTREAFAPFGDVIETEGAHSFPDQPRHVHALPRLGQGRDNGRQCANLISLLRGKPYELPLKLEMVERHPFGSQAFVPLSQKPFLVVAAHEQPDGPSEPVAFLTKPGQGVNIHRNVWHGILTPLEG